MVNIISVIASLLFILFAVHSDSGGLLKQLLCSNSSGRRPGVVGVGKPLATPSVQCELISTQFSYQWDFILIHFLSHHVCFTNMIHLEGTERRLFLLLLFVSDEWQLLAGRRRSACLTPGRLVWLAGWGWESRPTRLRSPETAAVGHSAAAAECPTCRGAPSGAPDGGTAASGGAPLELLAGRGGTGPNGTEARSSPHPSALFRPCLRTVRARPGPFLPVKTASGRRWRRF